MMRGQTWVRSLCLWVMLAGGWAASAQTQPQELIANPGFGMDDGQTLPSHWSVWKPQWEQAACAVRGVDGGLLVEAGGDPYAVGGVTQEIRRVRAGKAYRIEALGELRDIESPFRSVMVRLGWLKGDKPHHVAGLLVRGPVVAGGDGTVLGCTGGA